jgi:hypothetical protein
MVFILLMIQKISLPDTYIRYEASHLSTSLSASLAISNQFTTDVTAFAALYSFDLAPKSHLVPL